MKALLCKELKLCVHPTVYIFLGLTLMLLIPSYPYFVAFFYTTLGIFFTFSTARENRDAEYSTLQPVRKRDVVYARAWIVVLIELSALLVSVPIAFVSVKINPLGANGAGMDLGAAFYGLVFVQFAVFNVLFLPRFYKTAYKIGGSFLLASIASVLVIFALEIVIHVVPGLTEVLDSSSASRQIAQLPVLGCGIVLFAALTFFGAKRAAANFEKVDL